MYGWCTFRPRYGGRLVVDHLLQVILLLFCAFPAFALDGEESGDGFTGSDRQILLDVRSIASGNASKLTSIDTIVGRTEGLVSGIANDVEDIQTTLDTISSSQSYFNSTQQSMLNTLFNWELNGFPGTEDLPLIRQNTYNSATHLSYIRPDVSDILDNTTQMNGHLLNIDRETTESSDYLASIDQQLRYLISVSTNNAGGGDDLVVALTNSLSALLVDKPVDLSMVTNAAVWNNYLLGWALQYPEFFQFPEFEDFLQENAGLPYVTRSFLRDLLAYNPNYGLPMAILVSALRVDPYSSEDHNNLFDLSYDYWFGDYGYTAFDTYLFPDYTIFEAYNTLGLGVLTNQAYTLISQGVYVTNSLAVIVSNLVASLSVAEKTRDALYYPEDSETIYETTNHYSIPEWEPTYHAGIADNTNHYYYFQQADSFTRSLIGNYTSLLGRVIGGIKPQHRDWDAKITWSGWPSLQGQYGGWDLDVKLPETPDVVDFAKYIKFLSRLVCFVLDLLIVLLGATRIHKTVMGGKLPFES